MIVRIFVFLISCIASWEQGKNCTSWDRMLLILSDPISWPKTGSEKSTGPIAMKIGMHDPHNNIIKLIEAFPEVRPLTQNTGPRWGCPSGAQNREKKISIFSIFSAWLFTRMFLNYEKPPYSHFLVDLASEIILSTLISQTRRVE